MSPTLANQISLITENDLHYKVVEAIRENFPDLILIPGLGELQGTPRARRDACFKGDKGGQPDLIILNPNGERNGFALEMKTPSGKGVLSEKQSDFIKKMEAINYKTMVSNDYAEVLIEITRYVDGHRARYQCPRCELKFRKKSLRGQPLQ